MSLGGITVVSESAAIGPLKFTQIEVVGDSAYPTGGSVGFQDALQNLVDERRQVVAVLNSGVNGDAHLEYTPQGPPIPITAVTPSTDLLSTGPTLHGLNSGDAVEFVRTNQGPQSTSDKMPGGLAENVVYYVIASGLTTTAFKVSATVGGSAVDITDAGFGAVTGGLSVVKADKLLVRVMSTAAEVANTTNLSGNTYNALVISK